MPTNWPDYCKAEGLAIYDGGVEVKFDNGRTQKVDVEDRDGVLLLRSLVAKRAVVDEVPDAALLTWLRNRSASLAGFRCDDRGRIIGEAAVPKAGLTAAEFQFILFHLAGEADRFEFQLTGRDAE